MKYLFQSLIAFILFLHCNAVTFAEYNADLRFTCEEADAVADKAERIFIRLHEILQHQRELALSAANGTIGSADRQYFQISYAKLNDEAASLLAHATFLDSYGELYHFLRDGLEFKTLRYSSIDHLSIPVSYKIEPFELKTLGSLAKATFQIQPLKEEIPQKFLVIQNIALDLPQRFDDTVSTALNDRSAISLARKINSLSGKTYVAADVEENEVELSKIKFENAPNTLEPTAFVINGVSISGDISNPNHLVDAINNVRSSTGVKANFLKEKSRQNEEGIKLIAQDGRNIQVLLSEKMLPFFGGQLKIENVFTGRITFRSGTPFKLKMNFPLFGITGEQTIQLADRNLPQSDIKTLENAQEALAQIDAALTQQNFARAQIAPMRGNCGGER